MISVLLACFLAVSTGFVADDAQDYRVLATTKTSTMEKELNEAADAGYRFQGAMGGSTAFGGSEVVAIMAKDRTAPAKGRYAYKLLATSKTSTMQKELQEAGDEGYEYNSQTVFKSAIAGEEVVVILELDRDNRSRMKYEYKLLATSKTSTMQKELQQSGDEGYRFVGVTVAKTAIGGKEVVSILRKAVIK